MKTTPKWLLIPPVVAVLLILGPLSMQSSKTDEPAPQPAAAKIEKASDGKALPGSLVPRTPDLWKMGSTLLGVLLLGVGGIYMLRRLRGGAMPSGNSPLAKLRQSVRLSQRQSLHAIEFDNRILLIGEHERGLTLLDRGRLPDSASDEAEVLARADAPVEEDGATPKNLLIPRPDTPPKPPTGRASPGKVATATAQLNDFRNLLMKAER